LGFTKIGLSIGHLSHAGRGRHNSLDTLLGATTTPRGSLLGTTLLLEVHHTPHDENEDDHVNEETRSRWATCRSRNPRTQDSPDETECLGVRDDEKCETGNEGSDELLLLLPTIAATATVFKYTHDYF